MGLVQSASGTATAGTLTVTLGSPTTAGNCLIVCVGSKQGTTNPVVSGITLGGSAGNFAAAKSQNTNADANCEIWTDQNCAGGQTSVVISFTGGSGVSEALSAWVVEWAGLVTSSAVDAVNGQNGSGTSFSSLSTGTLAKAQEVVFGAVSLSTSGSPTITAPGAPWTELGTLAPTANVRFAAGYQQVAATTAQTYSGSLSGTSPVYGAVVVSLKIDTSVSVPVGTAAVTVTANPVVPSYPGAVVNQWAATFAQPAAFGTTPPALQGVNVSLTPAGSVGSGSGVPTAGNWLVAVAGINEQSVTAGDTVGVKDDIHSYWRPAKISAAAGLTRTAVWYTPNLIRAPSVVYVSPDGCLDALSVLVFEVTGAGPWDTLTAIPAAAYAAAATSLSLSLPAASATSFAVAAVTGDSTAAGQAFTPAGWLPLAQVSATNGVDHTCDAVLTTAYLPSNSGSLSVSASASSATDLSGVIIELATTGTSPIPGGQNPNWPYLILEAAFGSGFETPEDQMTWTSLNDVASQGSIRRFWAMSDSSGVPYALGQLQSSSGGYQLDNFDGALCPWNPGSPYYSNALNSNMSFQAGISPWTGNNNAAVASSSAHVFASAANGVSAASLQVTPDGVTGTPGANSDQVAISATGTYSASCWIYITAGYVTGANIAINWYNASHAYLSTTTPAPVAIPAGTWTQVTNLAPSIPGTAAYAQIVPQLSGTPTAATVFWVAEAAIAPGASAVATGLVTTGTPVRIRAALGTIKGITWNRWHVFTRNALGWPEKRNQYLRNFVPLTTTDIWSVAGASCPTPYRGEVQQDNPGWWWPMDDQPLAGGVQPASLRNAALGSTSVLNITASGAGVTATDSYATDGTDLTSQGLNIPSTPPPSVATFAVGQQQGWMYGDPQSSPASYQTSNPVTSNPGSAAWQQTGLLGNTGAQTWCLTCNDATFPPLSGGVTVKGWFNAGFLGSSSGATNTSSSEYVIAAQPVAPITICTLSTGSAPVFILQLDTSGHLQAITYNGTTPTSHAVYTTSDLRNASFTAIDIALTTTTWAVYVNGGLTASASGTVSAMTSAWTWLTLCADYGNTHGGTSPASVVHGGNVAYSHWAVFPGILPKFRILAHYAAAITGYGVLPAPTTLSLATAQNLNAGTSYTPDGTEFQGSYGVSGPAAYTFSALAVAQAGSFTSGPSARVISAGYVQSVGGVSVGAAIFAGFTALAPSVAIYTAASANAETNASTVCGSGDSYTTGFGSGASGAGVCHTAGGTGAAPPASASSLGDSVAQRAERILGYGLVTSPNRAIDYTASLLVQAGTDIGGQQVGASLQNLVNSDNGLLSVDSGNTLCYRSRPHLASDTVAWNIGMNTGAGQQPFAGDITWTSDPTRVYDVITLTPYSPDGASLASLVPADAAAADAAQAQYGPKPQALTSYLQDQTKIQAAANWWLATFGSIQRRAEVITIDAATHPAGWGLFFGVNPGDVVSVFDSPFSQPSTNGTYRVSNISRALSNGANGNPVEGRLTLVLDPLPADGYWS